MVADLSEALCVGGVEPVSLPSLDHFLLALDKCRVIAAPSSCVAYLVVLDVEDPVVLTHKGPSHQDLSLPTVLLNGHAVSISLFPVEVLTRVPLDGGLLVGGGLHVKVQHGIRQEEGFRALREEVLIVVEADIGAGVSVDDPLALAVMSLVLGAEPIEVHQQHVEQLVG